MEKYIKVWIKTESDLPKENRPYIVGYKRMDYDNGERDGWLGYFVKDNYYKKLWLRDIDYYLQPISDTELIVPSEEEIRIAGRKHSPTFGYWRSCRTESLIEKQKLKLWKKV